MDREEEIKEDHRGRARKLAREHVSWYQKMTAQLLAEFFVHGHKHGVDDERTRTK